VGSKNSFLSFLLKKTVEPINNFSNHYKCNSFFDKWYRKIQVFSNITTLRHNTYFTFNIVQFQLSLIGRCLYLVLHKI